MDTSSVTNRRDTDQTAPPPSTRTRTSADYARQAAEDDAVRQRKRAQENRDTLRRQSQSEINKHLSNYAFEQTLKNERLREKENMQAGVDKMVSSVIRKEANRPEANTSDDIDRTPESNPQTRYLKDKVDSAYSSFAKESPRDKELRPSPSELQQQRAVERYQDSTRNSIDRTVELVV